MINTFWVSLAHIRNAGFLNYQSKNKGPMASKRVGIWNPATCGVHLCNMKEIHAWVSKLHVCSERWLRDVG